MPHPNVGIVSTLSKSALTEHFGQLLAGALLAADTPEQHRDIHHGKFKHKIDGLQRTRRNADGESASP